MGIHQNHILLHHLEPSTLHHLVQIGPITVLPSRVFGFGLTLWIGFWIKLPDLRILSSTLVRYMNLGGRCREDGVREGGSGQQMVEGRDQEVAAKRRSREREGGGSQAAHTGESRRRRSWERGRA
jgi:hypothetical protein